MSPPVFQNAQKHLTRYVSMYHMMTKDYRRRAQSPCNRDSPGADDENLEGCFPAPPTSPQIHETPGQEGAGRLFCITGARDCSRSRQFHRHSVLKTYFQKLLEKAIDPHQATHGSMGYDLFTPVDFLIQPNKQKTVFLDLAVTPPEGYYTQLMSKSGLTVLYELEVKAGVIDPDFTGNIGVVLKNNSEQPIKCLVGEQIAQLLFIKVATPVLIQVTSLARTERSEYGFGAHNKGIRKQFQQGLQMLLDTFHDTILLYTQDIHVVNFSDVPRGFVNVIIMYENVEGRSVKLEAVGKIKIMSEL